jgi:hypothetical protein
MVHSAPCPMMAFMQHRLRGESVSICATVLHCTTARQSSIHRCVRLMASSCKSVQQFVLAVLAERTAPAPGKGNGTSTLRRLAKRGDSVAFKNAQFIAS